MTAGHTKINQLSHPAHTGVIHQLIYMAKWFMPDCRALLKHNVNHVFTSLFTGYSQYKLHSWMIIIDYTLSKKMMNIDFLINIQLPLQEDKQLGAFLFSYLSYLC